MSNQDSRLLRQIPLKREFVEEFGVRADEHYTDGYMLLSPIRAALWSGSYDIAREHAARAAKVALSFDDPGKYPEVLYLGSGLAAAQAAVRQRAGRTAHEIVEWLDQTDLSDTYVARDAFAASAFLVRPWFCLGLGEPPFPEAARVEGLAHSLVRDHAEGAEDADSYISELAAWRDLDRMHPAATRLLKIYDPNDDDSVEEMGWDDLPYFELIYAVDRLRAAGISHSLRDLRTLPPWMRERGGWWTSNV